MKEVQINGCEYLLIEVPEDAIKFKVSGTYFVCYLTKSDLYTWKVANETRVKKGFNITGKASYLTEQDWQQIVERFNNGAFRDYSDKKLWSPDDDNIDFLLTATESGYSLLELHGFKPERTLILKRLQ